MNKQLRMQRWNKVILTSAFPGSKNRAMRRLAASIVFRIVPLALLYPVALSGQGSFLIITPSKTTMLIGESRTFRLVDQNGHMQHDVTWSVSDDGAFDVGKGDELELTAKSAGDYRLEGRSSNGSSDATITVMEGASLPVGTVKWSAGKIDGCKTTKIIPAVPSANGPDVYEQSQCEDGQYISAYTADGVLLWRRKMNSSGAPSDTPAVGGESVSTRRLDPRSKSVCDAISVGAEQEKTRDLLNQRKLAFEEGLPDDHEWVVDERNAQCRLWFDDKHILIKKRKTLVSE
jgi:hypothetical protein